VSFTNRWGGPISISEGWIPIFERHPESADAVVLGGYSGTESRNPSTSAHGLRSASWKTRIAEVEVAG